MPNRQMNYDASPVLCHLAQLNFDHLKVFSRISNNYSERVTYNRPVFHPLVPNAPFLYPLKTSENRKVFWCFQGVEKGYIGNKWVNSTSRSNYSSPMKNTVRNKMNHVLRSQIPSLSFLINYWHQTK